MVLMFLMVMAFVFGITAFAVLVTGMNRLQTARRTRDRALARYAAEAGLVFAMEQLWDTPAYCGVPDPPSMNGYAIDVTVTSCGAGNAHTVSAAVTY